MTMALIGTQETAMRTAMRAGAVGVSSICHSASVSKVVDFDFIGAEPFGSALFLCV